MNQTKQTKLFDVKSRWKQLGADFNLRPGIVEIENTLNIDNKYKKNKLLIWQITRETWFQIKNHDLNNKAAALTYSIVLSLGPLLAIALFFFYQFGAINKLINETLVPLVTSQFSNLAGEQLSLYLNKFVGNFKPGLLGSVGFATFFATVIGLLAGIEQAFNDIFAAKQNRPLWKKVLNYWTLLSITPFIVTFSTAKTAQFLSQYQWIQDIFSRLHFLGVPFSIFVTALGFSALFLILPNRVMPIKALFAGGLTAALLFQLLQKTNIYLTKAILVDSTAHQLYGTAPIIAVAFFFWIKLVWLVILVAACLTVSITNIMEILSPPISERSPDDGLIHCTRVFSLICKDFKTNGEGITAVQIINTLKIPAPAVDYWLTWLEKRRTIFASITNGHKRYFTSHHGLNMENDPKLFFQSVLIPQLSSHYNDQDDKLLTEIKEILCK